MFPGLKINVVVENNRTQENRGRIASNYSVGFEKGTVNPQGIPNSKPAPKTSSGANTGSNTGSSTGYKFFFKRPEDPIPRPI